MTDPAQDPTDLPAEASDASGQAADAPSRDEQPTWSKIAQEGEGVHSPGPDVSAEDNPYPKLQIGDPLESAQGEPKRRPSSLRDHIDSTASSPLQQPLPDKYTTPAPQVSDAPEPDAAAETSTAPELSPAAQQPTEVETMTPSTAQTSGPDPITTGPTARVPPPAYVPPVAHNPEPSPASSESNGAPAGTAGFAEKFGVLRQQRPEVLVGAAFVGGLILATILKKLARR